MTHDPPDLTPLKPTEASGAMPTALTIVIPCLNEEKTLGAVLESLAALRRGCLRDHEIEILVSDNGSTDRSREIAMAAGARVVPCEMRGYGAALLGGIRAASHGVIAFADADNTYDFLETPGLLAAVDAGAELVLGSRIRGNIHDGAMPFMHRHVGTPMLTFWINFLFSPRGVRISDCNSGFRCFRREAFLRWDVRSTGMEFASEMLIKAMKHRARYAEVPITLRPDLRTRAPHLKRWRDGMRHLLSIFSESPDFFCYSGLSIFALSWIVTLVSFLAGPVRIGPISAFGIHSMMFAIPTSEMGLALLGTGVFLSIWHSARSPWLSRILGFSEERLFWGCVSALLVAGGWIAKIFYEWYTSKFLFLGLEKGTLFIMMFSSSVVGIVFVLLTAHLIKVQARR